MLNDTLMVLLLGVVEGLTEFLPVSSTGHLILTEHYFDYAVDETHFFDIFIQLGAILAVVVLYWRRFMALIPQRNEVALDVVKKGVGLSGVVGLMKIACGCASAFVLGFLFHDLIKERLFAPLPVAGALIGGGALMIIVERWQKNKTHYELEALNYRQAFLIGVIQCLALWPGVSRSGATIIGGMLLGLSRKAAAEFSFLVAVPVMLAATLYDFIKNYAALSAVNWWLYGVGFVAAFVTAILAIKFMLAIISRYSFNPFGCYRIALGLLVLFS